MSSYLTCRNCAVDPKSCARRIEVASAIKGAGITSVKFRCELREAIYQPGQRVSVKWPVVHDGEDFGPESWPATVIVEAGSRFVIHVDDVESDHGTPARSYINNPNLFAKVSASKLAAINESARAICGFCGGAPAPDSICPEINNGWDGPPPSCVLQARPVQ